MSYDKDNIEPLPVPSNVTNLIGRVFSRLTVIAYAGRSTSKRQMWFVECECGTIKRVQSGNLMNGHTVSCGCLRDEKIGSLRRTHGMSQTHPLYDTWLNMRRRCYDPHNEKYPRYGERGITVCERWLASFANFVEDMGEKPSKRHTLERVDNDGDYCPENCLWALPVIQANNQHTNHRITYQGRTQTLAEWARELGHPYSRLMRRLRLGWSAEKTFSTPVKTA